MDLQVEELDADRRKLNIKVPEDVVSDKVKSAYRQMNRQISMPGFRPGKIPQAILEKQVPLEAMTQLWQDLMQEYYDKALVESGITPVGPPEIDHSAIKEIKRDQPFTFSVTVDVKPKFEFKEYKGLKYKRAEFKVSEEEVDESLGKYLEPFGSFQICADDHKVELGDHLIMDFEGTLDDEPLENGDARDYPVKVGDKKMIAGFEDQLIGHKKGEEFEVRVQLPADWNKKVRRVSMPIPGAENKTEQDIASFNVRIKEVKKLILPELTDDFAQEQGEESVAAFRRKVKADIQAYKEHLEEMRIKQDIFNYLVKEHDIKPPESLVKQELKFMIDGMKFQVQQQGMTLEDSGFEEERAEKEWRERAEFNSKGYFILESIAKREKLNVSQSDLEVEYERLAKETGKKVEEVKQALFNNPEHMNQTSGRLLGQKALNLIYDNCEFEFVPEGAEKKESESTAAEAKEKAVTNS